MGHEENFLRSILEVSRVHEREQLEQRQQLAELQQKLNDSSREHSKTGRNESVT